MISAYQRPGARQLRSFGLLFGLFFILVAGILVPLLGEGPSRLLSSPAAWPLWPWAGGGLVMAWALAHPASLHLLHRPWMAFADVAGWLNTRLVMVLLFYLLILPIGLALRLFGHDPMRRRFDRELRSYRTPCQPQDREHMRHPY